MKRVTQGGDINFNVADVRGLGENYAFRFYTTDNCKYIVKVDGDAVDGIIRLEWEELKTLGDGVLNYCGENLEPDEEYSDATFNRTFGGTTQWYIVTSCGGSGTSEEITELSDRLDAEIERSTGKDDEHDAEIGELNETVQTIQANTYTKDEVYTQQEVNDLIGEGIVSIDTIEQSETSTESGGKNVLTITKTDGTSSTFEVYNGAKGDTGSYTVTDGVVTVTVINDLETDDSSAALSAAQGKKLNDNLSDLSSTIEGKVRITGLSETNGKKINTAYGSLWTTPLITDSNHINSYSYTEPFNVSKGQTVIVNAAADTNTCVIGVVRTVDDSYYVKVGGENTSNNNPNIKEYTWTATDDCQVAISFNANYGYTLYLMSDGIFDSISALNDAVTQNTAAIDDMYTKQEVAEAISSAIEDMPTGDIPTKLSELENDSFYVQDENYVHTDNNFTTADKTALDENTLKINSLEIESGTFAQAYEKALSNNNIFQWLMVDEDKDGNDVTKIIWHTGDKHFIDAIGSEISGSLSGLTVVTTKDCKMRVISNSQGIYAASDFYKIIPLTERTVVLQMEDIKPTEGVFGEAYTIRFEEADSTDITTDGIVSVDFGGLKLVQIPTFSNMTELTSVSNLVIGDITLGETTYEATNLGQSNALINTTNSKKLNHVDIRGNIKLNPNGLGYTLINGTDTGEFDFSKLSFIGLGFSSIKAGSKLDIRGMSVNNSSLPSNGYFLGWCSLDELVIGHLDTTNITVAQNPLFNGNLVTLVFVDTLPPTINTENTADLIIGLMKKPNAIKVPQNCRSAYCDAIDAWTLANPNIWGATTANAIKNKISEFNEGEY